MKLDFSKRITVPENVMMRELDGESVLLNLDLGIYFGLDDIGTNFCTLSLEEICRHISEQFPDRYSNWLDALPDVGDNSIKFSR